MPEFLLLGKVGRAHGRTGTIKANFFLQNVSKLLSLSEVWLRLNSTWNKFFIHHHEVRSGAWYLSLEGIDSISKAEDLRNAEIGVPYAHVEPLPENTYYHFQLEGLNVMDAAGQDLGEVIQVVNHPASDYLLVRTKAPEGALTTIPLSAGVIQKIELEKNRIILK